MNDRPFGHRAEPCTGVHVDRLCRRFHLALHGPHASQEGISAPRQRCAHGRTGPRQAAHIRRNAADQSGTEQHAVLVLPQLGSEVGDTYDGRPAGMPTETQDNTRPAATPRRAIPRPISLAVFVVFAAVSVATFVVTRRVIDDQEHRLLVQRHAEVAHVGQHHHRRARRHRCGSSRASARPLTPRTPCCTSETPLRCSPARP